MIFVAEVLYLFTFRCTDKYTVPCNSIFQTRPACGMWDVDHGRYNMYERLGREGMKFEGLRISSKGGCASVYRLV